MVVDGMSLLSKFLGAVAACAAGAGVAAPAMPPQLAPDDQAEYGAYLEALDHRAFAIAPGGAWSWVSGQPDAATAEKNALSACQAQTRQRCVSYSIDGRTTFDTRAWTRLWGPYATAQQARGAAVGTEVGQRFLDLAFTDADGARRSISSLKGKVVVVHFWGAWCPPCRREMPDLQRLHAALGGRKDIVFMLLQARENFRESRAWAAMQGIRLPLSDSGSAGDEDPKFRLAAGGAVNDREIASRFPTTYVLDKRGLVVFSHVGPVADWLQYQSFLRDVAERSGK
jgi:thiol-disulfide isomerase/thioredoxin